jgi:hypothetical protein
MVATEDAMDGGMDTIIADEKSWGFIGNADGGESYFDGNAAVIKLVVESLRFKLAVES